MPSVHVFGDGSDVTEELQDMLDAAALRVTNANRGETVFLPAGLYGISNLRIANGVRLQGQGMENTMLISIANNPTTELGLITLKNPTTDKDVEIVDLAVHGNSSVQSQALDGINFTQTGAAVTDKRHLVERVFVQNCKGDGIQIGTRADNVRLRNVRVQQNDAHGIHENGAADLEIYNSQVYTSGLHGIYLAVVGFAHLGNVISGNSGRIDSTNFGDGFNFNSANCVAFGCEANDNLRDGVSFTTGQNVFTGSVSDNVRDHFRFAGGDNYVDAGQTWSGSVTAANLCNFISGTRNTVRIGNPTPSAQTAVVSGTVGGNSVDIGPHMAMQNISFSTPLTPNPYRGRTIVMTLTGDITINSTAPNQHAGQRLRFVFLQDGTGGRTPTFNAQYLMPAAGPAKTLNKTDSIEFEFRSTDGKWVPTGPWITAV